MKGAFMDNFVPDIYQKSIYFINYEKLLDDGIRCLLFDLDNTCVPYKVKAANDKLVDLFENLKDMGFKLIIFSNATKKRIAPNLSEVAIIGDQLYKDILGGNRVGIKTILVNPMSKDDMIITQLIFRRLEKIKYQKLAHKNLLVRGRYYE